MLISVIVTTYNRPDALEAVLLSLLAQTDLHYECIIADDGSGAATQEVVDRFRQLAAQTRQTRPATPQVHHAWQSDTGFRLSAVRNLGVYTSQGDYLIFLDGDCVVRPNFVSRHRALAEQGFMVTGKRVMLSEKWTAQALLADPAVAAAAASRSLGYWLLQRLSGNANKIVAMLIMPDSPLRHYRKFSWRRIMGCNLGIWRKDYAAVNGFDETFVGWGDEDNDLVLRLWRHGVRRKSGAISTEVLHLWHKKSDRTNELANRRRVEQRMENGVTQAEVGLRDYPREDQRITC